jgi:TP901 family phage tail tape measure protein
VVLLATATGTELAAAVDLATSAIGAFNLRAQEMGNVANLITAATNQTKLTVDKLALGFQYSANIANEAGVSISQLTAALGVMSNAGIRSGSTLGSGMRQILIGLQKPSADFVAVLDRLGLSTADVSLETHDFTDVLKTLRDAGFSAADGVQVFETRAAAAFAALIGRVDDINDLNKSIVGTNAAAEANATQMESLSNVMARFGSVLGITASVGLEPVQKAMTALVSMFADLFIGISAHTTTLQVFSSVLASLAGGALLTYFGKLGVQLFTFLSGARSAIPVVVALAGAETEAAVATTGLGLALKGLLLGINPYVAAFAVATAAIGAFIAIEGTGKSAVEASNEAFDQAKAAVNEATDAYGQHQAKVQSVQDEYVNLLKKQESLRNDQQAFQAVLADVTDRFGGLKDGIFDNVTTVEQLIQAFRDLKKEFNGETIDLIDKNLATMKAKLVAAQANILDVKQSSEYAAARGELNVRQQVTGGRGGAGFKDVTPDSIKAIVAAVDAVLQSQDPGAATRAQTQLLNSKSIFKDAGKAAEFDRFIAVVTPALEKIAGIRQIQTGIAGQQRNLNAASVNGELQRFGFEDGAARLTNIALNAKAAYDKASTVQDQATAAVALKAAVEQLQLFLKDVVINPGVRSNLQASIAAGNKTAGVAGPAPSGQQLTGLITGSEPYRSANDALQQGASTLKLIQEGVAKTTNAIATAQISTLTTQAKDTTNKIDELITDDANQGYAAAAIQKYTEAYKLQRQVVLTKKLDDNKATDAVLRKAQLETLDAQFAKDTADVERVLKDVRNHQATTGRSNLAGVYRNQAAALEKALSNATSNVLPNETPEDIDRRADNARKILDQWHAVAEKALTNELSNPTLNDAEKTAKRTALNDKFEELLTGLNEKIIAMREAAAGPLTRLSKALDGAKLQFSKLDQDFSDSVAIATFTSDAQKRKIDAASLKINAGRVTPLTVANLQNSQEDIETKRLKAVTDALQIRVDGYNQSLIPIDSRINDAKAQLNQLKADLDAAIANKTLNPGEVSDRAAVGAQGAYTKGLDEYNAAQKDRLDLTKKSTAAQQELNASLDEVTQRTQPAAATSLQDVFNNVIRYASGADEATHTLNYTIENTLVAGIDAAKTGLNTFFNDIFTGTKSAGEAFKALGQSILQSMLSVVTNELTKQFMSIIFGLLSGGSGTATGAGGASSMFGAPSGGGGGFLSTAFGFIGSLFGFNGGGMVKANAGYAARDNRMIGVRDGEYVLRQSATAMIGKDRLDEINAAGNSVVSRSARNMGTPMPQRDPGLVNVWLVAKDQVPPPSPRDIITTIADNIQNGGSIKSLIKQVAMGAV